MRGLIRAGQILAGAGHISGVVDIPNSCATLWLPTEIFDFDINPGVTVRWAASRTTSTCRLRWISEEATKCPCTATFVPVVDRSRCCGRWLSSRRRLPARNAVSKHHERSWWHRRCRAWTRLAVQLSLPTKGAPMRRSAARNIPRGEAVAQATRFVPTRHGRSKLSARGCSATEGC